MLKVQNKLFPGTGASFGTFFLFLVFSLVTAAVAHALSFNTPVNLTVGNTPRAVVTGDFNGDGKTDLAVANQATNNISILLGSGSSTFAEKAGSPFNIENTASGPVSVAVGDFDRDGRLDLAIANASTSNITILLGDGSGNFVTTPAGSPFNLAGGITPVSIATADFNRDGRIDLVVANMTTNNVSILLGGASGTFGGAVNFNVGITPFSVTVGDFNLDGKPDIAVANSASNNVSILLGDGTGSFPLATTTTIAFNGGTGASSIAAADFNQDGVPDLAVANVNNNISLFLGVGDGTFNAPINLSSATSPSSIAIGDYNGDGIQDLAVANLLSGNFAVLLGKGDGTFAAVVNFAVGTSPFSIAAGDFNLDGKPDLATANGSSNSVSVLINTTSFGTAGTFDKVVSSNVGTGPDAITNADFDLDGKLDLAVANFTSSNVSVLLSAGFGNFFAAIPFAAGTGPSALIPGDFNRDGKPDLAVANSGSNNVSVLFNSSANPGTFLAPVNFVAGGGPRSLATADFNLDGRPDLAVANDGSNNVTILIGDGSGNFAAGAGSPFSAGTGPRSIVTGDFNRDGKPDLAVANSSSNNVTILIGDGSGNFAAPVAYAAGTGPRSIVTGDFNRDGKPDLAVANDTSNNVSVLLGIGNGTFAAAVAYAAGTAPTGLVTGDFNLDGKPDLAVTNSTSSNVSILSGNGNGTFAAAINYSAGANPVSITAGAFKNDGALYLVVANGTANTIGVLTSTTSRSGQAEGVNGGGGGCFIATVAYGSYLDPHVQALRKFRDTYLLTNRLGRLMVSYYYKYSPPMADYIRQQETLRTLTRWALTPIAYIVGYPVIALWLLVAGIITAGVRKRRKG
jgi:hypothetical protein